jgi:hypothetical protein
MACGIGIDGDAVALGRRRDRRPAVAVDGDRAGDGQRPILAGIERGDDAARGGEAVSVRERGAWLRDAARIGVATRR